MLDSCTSQCRMHLHSSDQRQIVQQRLQADPRAAAAHDVRDRHLHREFGRAQNQPAHTMMDGIITCA